MRPFPLHNPEGAQGLEAPGTTRGKSEKEGLRGGGDLEKKDKEKFDPGHHEYHMVPGSSQAITTPASRGQQQWSGVPCLKDPGSRHRGEHG